MLADIISSQMTSSATLRDGNVRPSVIKELFHCSSETTRGVRYVQAVDRGGLDLDSVDIRVSGDAGRATCQASGERHTIRSGFAAHHPEELAGPGCLRRS